jgi:hypothetical protein
MSSSAAVAAPTPAMAPEQQKKPRKPPSNTHHHNMKRGDPSHSAVSTTGTGTGTGTGSGDNNNSAFLARADADEILQTIASKASTLHQPQITVTCYIPTHCVGAVIGRRGSTIAQIQRHAQQHAYSQQVQVNGGGGTASNYNTGGPVRVSIVGHEHPDDNNNNNNNNNDPGGAHTNANNNSNNNNNNTSVPYTYSELDWSSPHWTPVVVRADPCAALTACSRLLELVENELDDVVMDVPLSRTKHAALVGKRGLVLANLSADTNVRIMVPRRELRHDVIQLEGELSRVKLCLERVLTIASDANTNTNNNNNNNNNSNNNNKGGGGPLANNHTHNNPKQSGNNNNNPKQSRAAATSTESSSSDTHPNTNNHTSSSTSTSTTSLAIVVGPLLPSQTKLRTVSRKTDTSIKKRKVDGGGGDIWQLVISGSSQEQVQSAISILQKWVDDNNNNNTTTGDAPSSSSGGGERSGGGGRGRGRGGRGGGPRNSNNNNSKDRTATAPKPKSKPGNASRPPEQSS